VLANGVEGSWGFSLVTIQQKHGADGGNHADGGAGRELTLVSKVESGGHADLAGLQPRDWLVAVNGTDTTGADRFTIVALLQASRAAAAAAAAGVGGAGGVTALTVRARQRKTHRTVSAAASRVLTAAEVGSVSKIVLGCEHDWDETGEQQAVQLATAVFLNRDGEQLWEGVKRVGDGTMHPLTWSTLERHLRRIFADGGPEAPSGGVRRSGKRAGSTWTCAASVAASMGTVSAYVMGHLVPPVWATLCHLCGPPYTTCMCHLVPPD
jgi:hypothetical protein